LIHEALLKLQIVKTKNDVRAEFRNSYLNLCASQRARETASNAREPRVTIGSSGFVTGRTPKCTLAIVREIFALVAPFRLVRDSGAFRRRASGRQTLLVHDLTSPAKRTLAITVPVGCIPVCDGRVTVDEVTGSIIPGPHPFRACSASFGLAIGIVHRTRVSGFANTETRCAIKTFADGTLNGRAGLVISGL